MRQKFSKIKIINEKNYWQFEICLYSVEGMNDYQLERDIINRILTNTTNQIFIKGRGINEKSIKEIIDISTNSKDSNLKIYTTKNFEIRDEIFNCMFGTIYLINENIKWSDFIASNVNDNFLFQNKIIEMSIYFNDLGNVIFKIAKDTELFTIVKKELEHIGYTFN